jgi:hypothetical protein
VFFLKIKILYKSIIFIIDLYGNKVDINHIEKSEQDLAKQYNLKNNIVLELDARYDSVSCIINSKLNNKNKLAIRF